MFHYFKNLLKQYIYCMREVILYFPNNVLMAEFILSYRPCGIETNTLQLTLTGFLTEQQIVNALIYYQAELFFIRPKKVW